MQPPFPSVTAEWHNDTYPYIDPSRPELSAAGKTVIITGAGTGIGSETAVAFATAGAEAIALLGRTVKTLEDTKKRIEADYPSVKVTVHSVDVASESDAQKAAAEIGDWDVLILNAGYLSDVGKVEESNVDEWWKGFEINVKGSMVMSKAFLPSRRPNAALVGTSSAIVSLPGGMTATFSSYVASKLAVIKFFEILAAEVPDVHVVTLHPGVIKTAMAAKSGLDGKLPEDTIQLPAHFAVWLVSPEAAFTRGKFIWTNWDAEQLKAREEKVKEDGFLTGNISGWPFSA